MNCRAWLFGCSTAAALTAGQVFAADILSLTKEFNELGTVQAIAEAQLSRELSIAGIIVAKAYGSSSPCNREKNPPRISDVKDAAIIILNDLNFTEQQRSSFFTDFDHHWGLSSRTCESPATEFFALDKLNSLIRASYDDSSLRAINAYRSSLYEMIITAIEEK